MSKVPSKSKKLNQPLMFPGEELQTRNKLKSHSFIPTLIASFPISWKARNIELSSRAPVPREYLADCAALAVVKESCAREHLIRLKLSVADWCAPPANGEEKVPVFGAQTTRENPRAHMRIIGSRPFDLRPLPLALLSFLLAVWRRGACAREFPRVHTAQRVVRRRIAACDLRG